MSELSYFGHTIERKNGWYTTLVDNGAGGLMPVFADTLDGICDRIERYLFDIDDNGYTISFRIGDLIGEYDEPTGILELRIGDYLYRTDQFKPAGNSRLNAPNGVAGWLYVAVDPADRGDEMKVIFDETIDAWARENELVIDEYTYENERPYIDEDDDDDAVSTDDTAQRIIDALLSE